VAVRCIHADWHTDVEDGVMDPCGRIKGAVREQVKRCVDVPAQAQEIRQAVREGRHKTAP
jgi:hypothetical protein